MGIDLTDFGAHFTLLLIFILLHRTVTLGLEFRLIFELQTRIARPTLVFYRSPRLFMFPLQTFSESL
jgi:hypothetical protein